MTEYRMAERLIRLKTRPTLSDYDDDYLQEVLITASDCFVDYCNREDDSERYDSIICQIAAVMITRLGVEGSGSASEGTMTRAWEGGDLPDDIRLRLNNYRKVTGV